MQEERSIRPYRRGSKVVAGHKKMVNVSQKANQGAAKTKTSGARSGLKTRTVQIADTSPQTNYPAPEWYATSEISSSDAAQRSDQYEVRSKIGKLKARNFIDPETGEGKIELEKAEGENVDTLVQVIQPGANIKGLFLVDIDYRRANLEDTVMDYHIMGCDFRGANLRRAELGKLKFGNGNMFSVRGSIFDTTFDGASCQNASFQDMRFLGKVGFRGTDLAGADFSGVSIGAMLPENGKPLRTTIDFTDSNVSGEQIDELIKRSLKEKESVGKDIKYHKYSLTKACAALKVKKQDAIIMIWAGDIEVRDNKTGVRVVGEFNKNLHHIPQWAVPATNQN